MQVETLPPIPSDAPPMAPSTRLDTAAIQMAWARRQTWGPMGARMLARLEEMQAARADEGESR